VGYLAYLTSLTVLAFKDTTGLTFAEGLDIFLDIVTKVNRIMFWVVLFLWSFLILVYLGLLVLAFPRATSTISTEGRFVVFGGGECTGCIGLIMLIALLTQWVVWRCSVVMANSWGPEGYTDPVKFWVMLGIIILLGIG